jgi:hypothetical protein
MKVPIEVKDVQPYALVHVNIDDACLGWEKEAV